MTLQSEVYDEQTFRHFLAIERWRAERAARSFFLVLVDFKGSTPGSVMPPQVSARLFSVLLRCLREVDFVGWYSQGTTVGAVLTQRTVPDANAVTAIVTRFHDAFAQHLPERVFEFLDVRVREAMADDEIH